jgi:signal transduction histidine kinase
MTQSELNIEVLDALLSHIDQVIYIRDLRIQGFPIIYVNDAFTQIWASKKEELYANSEFLLDSIHPDDRNRVVKETKEFLYGNAEKVTKCRIIDANSNVVQIQARAFITKDDANVPQYIVSYVRNITDEEKYNATLMNLNASQDLIIQLLTQDLTLPISGVKYLTRSANHQIKSSGAVNNTDYIVEVIHQLNGVMKMLEDLLIYLEIKANRVRFTYSTANIKTELNSVVKVYERLANRKSVKINTITDSFLLKTDIIHFHQILGNILSNAIKFTPSNGVIDIKVNHNSEYIELSVIDSGVGMSSELLEVVTEPFKGGRLGLEGERSFSIGLYISKRIMQLMGGDLKIASEVSKGTTVILRFPI